MYLHPHDSGISTELAIYKIHEPECTSFYKQLLKPGFIVVDLGSNIGYYAILASKIIGKTGKVIAIEPEFKNYSLLKRNLELNNCNNVSIYQYAIGPTNNIYSLFLSKNSNTHSMLNVKDSTGIKSIKVQTKALDSLLEEVKISHVDLIRMDIEGYEVEAIKGMINTLKNSSPYLAMELHCDMAGHESIGNLLITLKNFGYELICAIDRDMDFKYRNHSKGIKYISLEELLNILHNYRVVSVFLSKKRD